MALQPWREIAEPRDDVCRGNFQQAEFAADISAVSQNRARAEYQNPENFFSMTYITAGMKDLIKAVLKRISGTGGDPVIQLKTSFGGGKTHSLVAVYHIAKQEVPLSTLNGIGPILQELNIIESSKAKVVVIDGTNQNVSKPRVYGNFKVNTLWGDIAWQLGGAEAYELVKANDLDGTAPTKDLFIQILSKYSPVVILMDELVRYISQFEENKKFVAGTYNSNLSFIQNLTEAIKQVPTAVLLASLPDSTKEAGDAHGEMTLQTLEHYFGRVHAIWRPIDTQESFEIVRRRLFKPITNDLAKEEVCRAFADTYITNPGAFPADTQEGTYYEKLLGAYPIHPELFDRLYTDWSSLPNFQRTRGVLRLMAKIIVNLWAQGNRSLLIMPGSLPLDTEAKSELLSYLPAGWDPVIEGDVDGDNSEAHSIDVSQPRFGKELAARKVARTIFLGSAPGSQNKLKLGIDKKHILLGVVEPNQSVATYSDALDHLSGKLHYLNIGNENYWFDTRPNLIKEMEERKKRFDNNEIVDKESKKYLQSIFKQTGYIQAVHIFPQSQDVPDTKDLRLVVLPLGEPYLRTTSGFGTAESTASAYLKFCGVQQRKYQNRLIFAVADGSISNKVREQIISVLAYSSIIDDYERQQINLDNFQAETARKNKDSAIKTLKQLIHECYSTLLVPESVIVNGSPEEQTFTPLRINPGVKDSMSEIARILVDEEYVISGWAPIHLRTELSRWYWTNQDAVTEERFWDDSCRYLYLPRLSNESVLHDTIREGSHTKEYFGIAYGFEEGKYIDFRFGEEKYYTADKAVLLIKPDIAEAYQQSLKPVEQERPVNPIPPSSADRKKAGSPLPADGPTRQTTITSEPVKNRFYGEVSLSSSAPVADLDTINDEVIRALTNTGANVKITVLIEAELNAGFDATTQRNVKENAGNLKFESFEFSE